MSHRNVLTRRFLSILILNNDRSKTRGCITSVNHLHQLVYRKRYADKKQVDTQFYMTFMRISTVTLYMYILPKWIKFNSNCHASITYYYFINFFFLNSIIIWTNLFLRCSICKYINIETNYSNKKLENIDFDKSSWIIARRGSLEDQSTGKFLGFFLQRIVGRCEHSLALFLDPKEKELAHRWLSRPPSFILEGWPSTLVLPLLCPSPSQAHREAGFIFDRTFAPLRSRLRKVERDNRYVFVYSRHLDRWRDAISSFLSFFQPSPLYLLQTIPFIEPLASSDLLFVHPFLTISSIR